MTEEHRRGRIASVVGRYYAMDRDRRWERVHTAYDLFVAGDGLVVDDPVAAVEQQYLAGITDEFMVPLSVRDGDEPPVTIGDGDSVVFFNFRADRAREITQALIGPEVEGQTFANRPANLTFIMMTDYANYFPAPTAFPAIDVVFPIARVISESNLRQFHTAETEKYPHVTYFFNGGREEPFPGEDRNLTPSPKVATYDLQPEMSARGVGSATVDAIASGQYAFVIVNFANCDMVGHTGVISAAVQATETVDEELGKIVDATLAAGGTVLVTADHGNAEQMLVPGTNQPMTAHTTNPVPFILVSPAAAAHRHVELRDGGRLADVAPTVLALLHIAQPAEMTGVSLLRPSPEIGR
jgi:2,3-bisphosphoglycerate-independent phosphoglycerate mutase